MAYINNDKYYCSQKFTWLSVDIEKRLAYSCCSATPNKIDLAWLKKNPGQIFNTELLQFERQQMLDNVPVASCESVCWQPEKDGVISRRIHHKSNIKTHTDIKTTSPTTLNINLGSTCNLTCVYCCKQYSSSWRQDILNNGSYFNEDYFDQDRFNVNAQDKILLKISQSEHSETDAYNTILDEVSKFDQVQVIYISGGEPFLYNGLPTLLNKFINIPKIIVQTGLGIDTKRFSNQLSKIQNIKNLEILVSGENCGKLYEFTRYNNSWSRFLNNLMILKKKELQTRFLLTISNLTVFGLVDFSKQFTEDKEYNWCSDPFFLSVNVLDDDSKKQLIEKFKNENLPMKDHLRQQLITNIKKPCTEQQRKDLSIYLLEFSKRRKLDLGVFPVTLLQWLNLQNNHVV